MHWPIRRAINPFFESLVQTTPYIFAGLAVALGFRVGLFNIGVEGQIFMGAAAGCWAGYAITRIASLHSYSGGSFLWRIGGRSLGVCTRAS